MTMGFLHYNVIHGETIILEEKIKLLVRRDVDGLIVFPSNE